MEIKRSLFLLLFLFNCLGLLQAQMEKFHRAEIFLKNTSIEKLAALGVETDHGFLRPQHSFISDFQITNYKEFNQQDFNFPF